MTTNATYLAHRLPEEEQDIVVARVERTKGSVPRHTGATMILFADATYHGSVGGGSVEAAVCKLAQELLTTQGPKQVHHFDLHPQHNGVNKLDKVCGGEMDISVEFLQGAAAQAFLHKHAHQQTAVIFGAGHVGVALEEVLRFVGFETVVIDDRPDYANRSLLPHANKVIAVDTFEQAFQNTLFDDASYLIIVTRDHQRDYEVLKEALRRRYAYLGIIGSQRKTDEIFGRLRQEGISEEQLHKVYAPIGERILAETPEELAISIAAELIRVRAETNTIK